MEASQVLSHRLNNALHAVLLLGGLALLLMAIGLALGGTTGLLWVGVLGMLGLLFTPRISPAMILRMYRARPLAPAEAPALYELVGQLVQRAGLAQTPELFYVPTPLMNAFSVGRRDEAVIAVTDGLLRGLPPRELTGVLAHEIGHIRHNDMWIMSLADGASRIVRAMSFMGQVLILVNLPMYLLQYGSMPWVPLLLLVFAPTLSALLQLALSRNREFDADVEAARLTGDPLGLASALVQLEQHQQRFWRRLLWPGTPNEQPSLLRTHPNSEQRIERLRSLAPAEEPSVEEPPPSFAPPPWSTPLGSPRRRWHGLWY
ncbi:MAG TPA: zinc metalloprotease HtpX [bacterium]|nr:zinc metalloprotease HtpX [bacterium]